MTLGADKLSGRERQIMDAVYRLGEANVSQIREHLPDPPSYSATRTLVGILVEKGHLSRRKDGKRFVYRPVLTRSKARRTAIDRLLTTFFDGSIQGAMTAFLEHRKADLTDEELSHLRKLIDEARKQGK